MIDVAIRPERTEVGIEDVASILYVGNSFLSFNNGIGWHVSRLHASTRPGRRLRSTSAAITGGGLDWHDVDSYFRPNAIGAYSFDEANNVVFNRHDRLFDVVLMMGCSQCPIHPRRKAAFHASARKSSETVRCNGAKPAFLMTWAYADQPEMTAELAGLTRSLAMKTMPLSFRSGWPSPSLCWEGRMCGCTWTTRAIRPWPGPILPHARSTRVCSDVRRWVSTIMRA